MAKVATHRAHKGHLGPVERIIVPVEGSSQELYAQETAVEYASALHTPIRALHVAIGAEDPPEDVFHYLRDLCVANRVPFEHTVIHSRDVVSELVEELRATDLVIIGTRRLGREPHIGSVAMELIRRAPCTVQVVRLE